eukprot:gb/GECG01014891.1/.p1 GENE.gb/GECG01014891.1/~~gb/GECG01014891.1/.p1  ORF type:complete len:247 (+),score=26.39 gb/GECG01014891.1/:1-741(+)
MECVTQERYHLYVEDCLISCACLSLCIWNNVGENADKKSVEISEHITGSLLADASGNTLCALHKFSRNPILGIVLGVTDLEKSLSIFEGPLGMQKQPVSTSADPVWQAPRMLLQDENDSTPSNNDAIQHAKNMALLNYGDPLNAREFSVIFRLALQQISSCSRHWLAELLLYEYPEAEIPQLNSGAVLTFSVPNLRTAFDFFRDLGLETEPVNLDPLDIDFLFEHPDGYIFRVKELEPDVDMSDKF